MLKTLSITQASAIKISIGYPDYIKDAKILKNHYEAVSVAKDIYFFSGYALQCSYLQLSHETCPYACAMICVTSTVITYGIYV